MSFSIPNNKPIEHRCSNGNVFKCERADLGAKIIVVKDDYLSKTEDLISDVSEFIAWHALNIYPELKAFSGYSHLKYEIV